jgi:uncharacterized membrane protein
MRKRLSIILLSFALLFSVSFAAVATQKQQVAEAHPWIAVHYHVVGWTCSNNQVWQWRDYYYANGVYWRFAVVNTYVYCYSGVA